MPTFARLCVAEERTYGVFKGKENTKEERKYATKVSFLGLPNPWDFRISLYDAPQRKYPDIADSKERVSRRYAALSTQQLVPE